jgi:cobalt-precorrin 5A hydrolase / precorrin-3B C17-methyltransferase
MKPLTRPIVISRSDHNGVPSSIAKAIDGELVFAKNENVVPALQAAFKAGRPIVTNIAAPIVIRALAPILGNKFDDPPVIVTSYDGRFVVPILGISHGATILAMTIEEKLGWQRVTFGGTASYFKSGTPLDHSPDGYYLLLAKDDDYKQFAAAVLDGEKVIVPPEADWLMELPQSPDAKLRITVTDEVVKSDEAHLVFTSMTLAVGVGCERGTSVEEVQQLVDTTLRDHSLSPMAVAVFATIDLKEDEPAIRSLTNDDRTRFFTTAELNAVASRTLNPSEVVRDEVGTPSVSEAAALAAAGIDSVLIVPKTKSKRATCAVARAPKPILERYGRSAGCVMVAGIGPGDRDTRSPEVSRSLWWATDWVGYGLYLDLIADARQTQTEHRFPLGDEEARCRHAIELAKQGKRVALVCSGDAGIYAMAALVYELIDREPNRIAVEVHPGISAFQAASAKAGAMIGHDFCCISLSDLLTPWEVIEKRVKAAAEGDFVISFYNPRSLKRRDQLERAFAILKHHRPPETPVVIASNLGRPEEKTKIVRFDEFNPEEVDMLTLVMVGSTQSKSFKRGDGCTYAYTPRGYAKKMDLQ